MKEESRRQLSPYGSSWLTFSIPRSRVRGNGGKALEEKGSARLLFIPPRLGDEALLELRQGVPVGHAGDVVADALLVGGVHAVVRRDLLGVVDVEPPERFQDLAGPAEQLSQPGRVIDAFHQEGPERLQPRLD